MFIETIYIRKFNSLTATDILHTVGPVDENPEVLEACYNGCLELLEKNKIKTVVLYYLLQNVEV